MSTHTHSTHIHTRTRTWRDIWIQSETNSHIYLRRIRLGPQSRRSVRVHFHGRISYLPTIILISLEAVFSWLVVVICHSRGFDVIVTLLYSAVFIDTFYTKNQPSALGHFIHVLSMSYARISTGSVAVASTHWPTHHNSFVSSLSSYRIFIFI